MGSGQSGRAEKVFAAHGEELTEFFKGDDNGSKSRLSRTTTFPNEDCTINYVLVIP